jgi:hypothetical protein
MESGFVAFILLAVAAGIVIGICIARLCKSTQTHGIIHADYSDREDGPHLFLELKVPVSEIVSRKRVVFNVDKTMFYSHE